MKNKNHVVFGIFESKARAEETVSLLKAEGYRNSDISLLAADPAGSSNIGAEKSTKAPEGSAVGSGTGAAVGGVLGWLASAGVLVIPGVGPFLAAGPIMGLLAGAGIGGALGGIAGALVGLGIPEYEAKRYEGVLSQGKVLLAVHCDNSEWLEKAKHFLEGTGATSISATKEAVPPKPKESTPPLFKQAG